MIHTKSIFASCLFAISTKYNVSDVIFDNLQQFISTDLAVVSGFILLNEARIMKATVGKKRGW
jgi:hypothetical protein